VKIDFLFAKNQYDSVTYFSKKLAEALRRHGASVRLFSAEADDFYHAFSAMCAAPPDFTCSFSDITINQQPFSQVWQIPHLHLAIDPVIYSLHQASGYISCVDQADLHFLQKTGYKNSFFLPHAVDRDFVQLPTLDKKIGLAFFGSCIDIKKVKASWKEKYCKQTRILFEKCIERFVHDSTTTLLDLLLHEKVDGQKLPLFHAELDLYCRGWDRIQLLSQFEGLDLHIWGSGAWKEYIPTANMHLPISFNQALEKMRACRFVLNSSIRFKHGSHERIFCAMAAGAICVTGNNDYIRQEFTDELITYEHGDYRQVREKVQRILKSPQQQETVAGAAKWLVEQRHTFDARAHALLGELESNLETRYKPIKG